MKRFIKYLSLVVFALLLLLGLRLLFNADEIKEKQKVVDLELKRIRLPDDGQHISYLNARRPTSAMAQASSKGSQITSHGELVKYFDEDLRRGDWRFLSEEKTKDWWRDYGGMSRLYCKKGMQLNLQYAGNKNNSDWTYALSIVWEGDNYCG